MTANPLGYLVIAAAAFVGSHLLLSHPLRAPLSARFGAGGFMGLYSVVALATFGWMVFTARAMPAEAMLWTAPGWLWPLAAAIMLFASILLAGSLVGNPALPAPGAGMIARRKPHGVFLITRHPMMWSFALWGAVHIAIWPTPSNLVIAGAIILLALAGAAGQDAKKAALMGSDWKAWMRHTAFVPFAGSTPLRALWPGWGAVGGGALIWLLATWVHGLLGAPTVAIWR